MKWIAIEERLPELTGGTYVIKHSLAAGPSERVLVARDDGRVVIGALLRYSPKCEWRDDCGERVENVTHWMPMPEPPEEEDQDAKD